MKGNFLVLGNYFLFLAFAALVVALQNSLWMQFLGSFPAPQLWIPVMVYWFLHRAAHESLVMTYLLVALAASQTSLPFPIFLAAAIMIFLGVWLIKQRIYWPGSGFYTMCVGGSTAAFFLLQVILSFFLEPNPLKSPEIFHWILSPLLTMLFALLFFPFFTFFDHVTSKVVPRESQGGAF